MIEPGPSDEHTVVVGSDTKINGFSFLLVLDLNRLILVGRGSGIRPNAQPAHNLTYFF